MTRTNTPDAKNRILQAAIKIFAEKSYEGSRVDEIAAEANVPKSLIYYHFKRKEEILEVLIENFLSEYTKLLEVAAEDNHQTKVEAMPGRIEERYAKFSMKNADLIRIILIDSLKKSQTKPVVFKVVEALIATEKNFSLGQSNYDRHERLVAEFFTSIIPGYAYTCFRNAWANYFEIETNRLDELMIKTFIETHGAYHKNHK